MLGNLRNKIPRNLVLTIITQSHMSQKHVLIRHLVSDHPRQSSARGWISIGSIGGISFPPEESSSARRFAVV